MLGKCDFYPRPFCLKMPYNSSERRCEDGVRMKLKERDRRIWSGFIWLRIGTRGSLL
jgi:hypothetical protein